MLKVAGGQASIEFVGELAGKISRQVFASRFTGCHGVTATAKTVEGSARAIGNKTGFSSCGVGIVEFRAQNPITETGP